MNDFVRLGNRWAFFYGRNVPNNALSTKVCYLRAFWRFFRRAPGLTRAEMLKLIALNASKQKAA